MMIEDVLIGYQARDRIGILQEQVKVCQDEKNQMNILNESYERDGVLLNQKVDNLNQQLIKTNQIADNRVKIEKKKSKKWKIATVLEGTVIILLVLLISH